MRTGILLLLAMMSLSTVKADDNITKSTSKIGVTIRHNDAVTFVERGIQFHVFLNGDFDFNTHYNRYSDYGVRINKDRSGRVRSVGNVHINYDARGNVTRIGSVYMKYKFGNLFKVGNLRIQYDRWGNPRYRGFVKPGNHHHYDDDHYYYDDGFDVNIDINIGDIFDYNDVYFYRKDFTRNYRQFREDNDFYYYRAVPNAKIGKKSKIIKRRKNKDDKYYKKGKPEQRGKSRRNHD